MSKKCAEQMMLFPRCRNSMTTTIVNRADGRHMGSATDGAQKRFTGGKENSSSAATSKPDREGGGRKRQIQHQGLSRKWSGVVGANTCNTTMELVHPSAVRLPSAGRSLSLRDRRSSLEQSFQGAFNTTGPQRNHKVL